MVDFVEHGAPGVELDQSRERASAVFSLSIQLVAARKVSDLADGNGTHD